jgi:AraC-like DNA-binding protein
LSHVFKDTFEYSPGNYLVRRRIGEAQTLLLTTNYSVIEIASSVGYNNVSHFNTIFKKLIGTTPKQYRKKYLDRESSRS